MLALVTMMVHDIVVSPGLHPGLKEGGMTLNPRRLLRVSGYLTQRLAYLRQSLESMTSSISLSAAEFVCGDAYA